MQQKQGTFLGVTEQGEPGGALDVAADTRVGQHLGQERFPACGLGVFVVGDAQLFGQQQLRVVAVGEGGGVQVEDTVGEGDQVAALVELFTHHGDTRVRACPSGQVGAGGTAHGADPFDQFRVAVAGSRCFATFGQQVDDTLLETFRAVVFPRAAVEEVPFPQLATVFEHVFIDLGVDLAARSVGLFLVFEGVGGDEWFLPVVQPVRIA